MRGRERHDAHPGGLGRGDAGGRILDHEALARVCPERLCRFEVRLGVRLAAGDVVRGDQHVRDRVPDRSEPPQRQLTPAGRRDRPPRRGLDRLARARDGVERTLLGHLVGRDGGDLRVGVEVRRELAHELAPGPAVQDRPAARPNRRRAHRPTGPTRPRRRPPIPRGRRRGRRSLLALHLDGLARPRVEKAFAVIRAHGQPFEVHRLARRRCEPHAAGYLDRHDPTSVGRNVSSRWRLAAVPLRRPRPSRQAFAQPVASAQVTIALTSTSAKGVVDADHARRSIQGQRRRGSSDVRPPARRQPGSRGRGRRG